MQTANSSLRSAMHGLLDENLTFNSAMRAANTMAGKGGKDFEKLKDQIADLATQLLTIARDALTPLPCFILVVLMSHIIAPCAQDLC